ncbi:MAG: hypothetical protein RSE94_11700 [Pseudomonas sp.]
MKLIALCGAAGAGKDTVADMLPARKLAFADALYREVAEAWGVTVEWLKDREQKERPVYGLAFWKCKDDDFHFSTYDFRKAEHDLSGENPRSPRQILQLWGDYRRAQDPDYFVKKLKTAVGREDWWDQDVVITDVRFPNEAALVRQLGGQLWQIRRPGYEAGGTGHASDTDGGEFRPDVVLENFGDLEFLKKVVLTAWGAI